MNISELVAAKDKEKQYRFELEQMRELLKHEQERTKRLMEEVVTSSSKIVIYPSSLSRPNRSVRQDEGPMTIST